MHYAALLRAARRVAVTIAVLAVVTVIDLTMFRFYHVHLDAAVLPVPIYAAFLVGSVAATVFAFVFGGLADDNDGHLPVAWTLPASRTTLALARFGVEAGAIVVIFALFSAVAYFVFSRIGAVHTTIVPADWPAQLGRFIIAPLSAYALAQATTASLGKQAGLVRGFSLAGMYVFAQLAVLPLAQPFAALVRVVNAAIPWTYLQLGFDDAGRATAVGTLEGYVGLILISIVGFSAAVMQWRRLEA